MSFLFWTLWSLDLGIGLLLFFGKGFRRSFTATDPTFWFDVLLISCIIGGFLLRVFFKRSIWGRAVVALPLLVLLIWYLLDKSSGLKV